MRSVQKITIVGEVGNDPVTAPDARGKDRTSFTVAYNYRHRDENGSEINKTQWFRVYCYDNISARANQYARRGSKVYIEGRLIADGEGNPRQRTLADGTQKAIFEVVAFDLIVMSSLPEVGEEQVNEFEF